jgi:hypothetical protein
MRAAVRAVPHVPVGEIKTFGPLGPKYEVLRALHPMPNGDWLVRICVVESGEETDYQLSQILADPVAD